MPKIQIEFYTTLIRNSAEIAKQLKIANELKALELKRAVDPSVKTPYEWVAAIDRILQAE